MAESRRIDGPIRGLDPRHYTDPALWEHERERILLRTWHYACHVAQVASAGDYVCLRVADQGVFVVRVETLCGFVFVNLDPGAPPMADWYGDVGTDIRATVPGIDGSRPVHEHRAEENCNCKVAVENYIECYHCRIAHPGFTRGVLDPASVEIHPREHTVRHTGRAVAGSSASHAFPADAARYFAFYLWPSFSVQVYPGRAVNTYWWRPLGVDRTCVHRGWLAPPRATAAEIEAVVEIADLDRRTTFAEDLPVVNTVQRGLASRGNRPGPLVVNPGGGVENEESRAATHGWVRAALAG